jgi:hypothetical protein
MARKLVSGIVATTDRPSSVVLDPAIDATGLDSLLEKPRRILGQLAPIDKVMRTAAVVRERTPETPRSE